jgi:hypothetical protein
MKQLKIIVALTAGLFAFTSANAGEMTVTGGMHATYQSEQDDVTGNPLGINTDLTFTGATDTDFGAVTWSMATDGTFAGDSGADHKLTLDSSIGTFRVGNTGDSANAVDDITPTAFEEANGAGSGTYAVDFGSGMEGSMNLGYAHGDILGSGVSVNYSYYPKLDGTLNNEKGASTNANAAKKSAQSINVGIPLAGLPAIGDSAIGGTKITLGYEISDATTDDFQNKEGGTVAVVVPVGPLKVGYQKKGYAAQSTTNTGGNNIDTFYKDDILGIAFAVNDELALSYNIIESVKHAETGANVEQETKAINVAYTIGGLTLALQDAKTDNNGYTAGSEDNTRTFSVKTGF